MSSSNVHFSLALNSNWNLPTNHNNNVLLTPVLALYTAAHYRHCYLNSKLFSFQPFQVPHPSTQAPQIRWFSSDIARSINSLT